MARCTYCKTKWKVKEVWSFFMKFEKDCPYCFGRQYMSDDTFRFFSSEIIGLPLLFLFPFLVDLHDESPLRKFQKK
ncbi:hypothetical protein D0U04_15755 [Bacillus clarus]|uniref:Putative group-specific protein n=1 Tax=Bacillus clarus TaxID=2338372 RepID=A0A090ZDU1_9BACI|nr:hypothetical protein [Bacillus clarus]KFN02426.1 putative group-specific protein [Bacillus clarus]RFT66012.1 hypothetical protein D0U04_15755 [Bacillus clarus]